jgi:phosphopantothenoylcysteine decarboxylase/phosphopantothenate--cysteine ligase
MSLEGKKIVLCVTGSVAAIMAPQLARELRRQGAEVHGVMSGAAQKIIHPDVLHWATDNKVVTELNGECQHVKLAGLVDDKADLIIVAPCTANTAGKIAQGIDDTAVTTLVSTAIGSSIPVILVPAMHLSLFQHPLTQENLHRLEKLGVKVIAPRLEEKKAKFPSVEELVQETKLLFEGQDFAGLKVTITAGGTREALDEVRFISNHSSGKMGLALAEAAFRRGAQVTLIQAHGVKTHLPIEVIEVNSAPDMQSAVEKHAASDILIHAAAVSDFTAAKKDGKIPSGKAVKIELKPSEKILKKIKQWNSQIFLVGFKAECCAGEELTERAKELINEADADLVVANDVSRRDIGFGSDFNEVAIVNKKGQSKFINRAKKSVIANKILDEIKWSLSE